MTNKSLAIVVVGHTNAGKTSLLRTLTRDKSFGEVSHRNATTKHVAKTSVTIAGKPVLNLFDTPGFEDSIEFRHYLRQFDDGRGRKEILEAFLGSPEAKGRFEQQSKVIRILLTKIDAILYVIDSTEIPLPKYVSELEVLSMCAIPVLPVLNFIQTASSHVDKWALILADRGLHIKVSFDAVAPMIGSERLLYTRLGTLLDGYDKQLLKIADAIDREAEIRKESALRAIAELLTDVGALRALVQKDDVDQVLHVTEEMHSLVRAAEQTCVRALLAIYCFDRSDLIEFDLPVIAASPENDLFNPEVIKEASIRLGLGAVIGAVIGLGVDIVLVGMTFGAGAIVGGAFGGMLVGSAKDLWSWADAKVRGHIGLAIDPPTLSVLLTRQLQLFIALNSRSHAAQQPLQQGETGPMSEHWGDLIDPINRARAHPEWSRLGGGYVPNEERDETVAQIQALLSLSCVKAEAVV
jgi:GTPase SAR1 family protein